MAESKARTPKSPRLGRGLSSLLAKPVSVQPTEQAAEAPESSSPTNTAESQEPMAEASAATQDGVQHLAIGQIVPNPHQPRQRFNETSLAQLAASIRQDGLMQPIVVRPGAKDSQYELVVGERRWRAAQMADLTTIPVVVRTLNEEQSAAWALVENLQREDLNAIERAEAFQKLADQFKLSHSQIADRVGVDRSSVSNALRLLTLHPDVQMLIQEDLLSAGQAKALAGLSDQEAQKVIAEKAIRESWSVRQMEQAIRKLQQGGESGPATADRPAPRQVHLADLERQITRQLGTKVNVKAGRKKGSGKLTINFNSNEHFEEILGKLGVALDE